MKVSKVLIIMSMIFLFIYAVGFRINEMKIEYAEAEYIIQPGDTLWSIATENSSEHQSIQ